MSAIRLPSEQELELVKLEKNFLKDFKNAVSTDHGIQDAIDTLAKKISQGITAKRDMITKMHAINEMLKTVRTDPNARVTQEQVAEYDQLVTRYAQLLENNQSLVDGLKDIILSYRSFLGKKDAYYQSYSKLVDLQSKFEDNVYKYRKLTNKLQTGDKVRQLEVDIRDEDNELDRQKKENVRQLASLVEEGKAVDTAWLKLKDFIKEFSF
jgi:hypothetical protein